MTFVHRKNTNTFFIYTQGKKNC